LKIFFTQICNNLIHLYAFVHKGIYYLPHTTIIRHTSEKTSAIDEQQRTSKKIVGHASDFKLCNQVLISRARYETITLKTKKMR
jgi:2'-5' RNA ligase